MTTEPPPQTVAANVPPIEPPPPASAEPQPPPPASLLHRPNIVGVPTDEAVEQPTVEDIPQPDDPGEYTDELSDFTDNDADIRQKYSHTGASTWYHRVQPLMRNKRVRVYAIANLVLFLVNVLLLLALMAISVLAIIGGVKADTRLHMDKPCLYEFGNWSGCSGNCTTEGVLNWRYRKVFSESVVHARGRFARDAPCPEDVENLVEKAPCNTHSCPVKLSTLAFRPGCWRLDASDSNSSCYSIRDIPIGDHAIEIDTNILTQPCNCSLPI